MGATDSIIWGAITTFGTTVLTLLGRHHMRRAALVEHTPTTPAASLVAADIVEIKGRVVAAESTLVAPLAGRQAVWTTVSIQEDVGSSTRSVLSEVRAVPFLVDDGSGRTARVVPRAVENAVEGTWEDEDRAPLERVLSLLATRGIKDFDREKLRWTERALFVGDPVYVLGHAKLGPAAPTSDGYRSVTSTQPVLFGHGLSGKLLRAEPPLF